MNSGFPSSPGTFTRPGSEPSRDSDIKIGFEWGGLTKEMKEAMRGQARGT